MKTILFAWELGGHYGHLAQLLPVARRLRDMGCDVCFALADISAAAELVFPEGIAFVQAPMVRQPKRYPGAPASYADIMRRFGFGDAGVLHSLVLAWKEIIRLVNPDLIVLHNAPVATLASFGSGVSRVTMGMGWDVPPLEEPMRRFWPRADVSQSAIDAIHADVAGNIATVLDRTGQESTPAWPKIFRTEKTLLSTVQELDHYPDRQELPVYVGPLFIDNVGCSVAFPTGVGPRVFIYLHAETPRLADVLKTLVQRDARYLAVLPKLDSTTTQQLQKRGWQVYSQPVKLECITESTDIAITNAGHGVLSLFALRAVPCVYIPSNIDQLMLATRAVDAGLGSLLRANSISTIGTEMDSWLEPGKSRRMLNSFRDRHSNLTMKKTVDSVVAHFADVVDCQRLRDRCPEQPQCAPITD